KVSFTDFERKFADRIPEDVSEIRLYELQRVDAEAIDVPFCYRVLIAADQRGTDLGSCAHQFLQRLEIAAILAALALPSECQIGSALAGPPGARRCEPRIAGFRRFWPFGDRQIVGA